VLAGQIIAKDRIQLVDVPEARLDRDCQGDDGGAPIIFQPAVACLCGSDIPYFIGEKPSYPLEPGYSLHEMVGVVKASRGARFQPGDRVLVVPVGQRGFYERYCVSEKRAIPLDARVPPEVALLAQPLGTVIFGLKKLPQVLDQDVAVVGAGAIGQLFCAALRNLGAREIIAIDRIDSRLELARRMGATRAVNFEREEPAAAVAEATRGAMADLVVEAVGHREQALNLCADLARRFARILYFGVPPETIDRVEWSKIFFKNLSIHTTVNPDFERDFPLAMRWIGEGRIDVRPLITHRFPLTEAQKAFETYRDRKDGSIKVLLEFPEGW
jgi:threonine dehydrogenase-like Zn-dependent dehydrogenase